MKKEERADTPSSSILVPLEKRRSSGAEHAGSAPSATNKRRLFKVENLHSMWNTFYIADTMMLENVQKMRVPLFHSRDEAPLRQAVNFHFFHCCGERRGRWF